MRPAMPETVAKPLAVNELLPEWPVRDEQGRPTDLRSLCEGRFSMVLCVPRPASPGARQAVKRLQALGADQAQPPLRVVVLPPETSGAEAIAYARDGVSLAVLRTAQRLGTEKQLAWAITDKAGRIRHAGRVRPAEMGRLAAHLNHPAAERAASADTPRSETAPVLILPGVIEKDLCKRLIAHFESSENQPSGILDLSGDTPQWRPDPAVKARRDMRLEDANLIREIEQGVAERVLPQIRKCFHYVVSHHEPFKLVRYDTGAGYFRPHRDNETRDTDYRRFAMTINLNTGDYDGGALQFPEFGEATYRPPLGAAIVFSCSLLHEATDVTRGRRYAVLGFFYNPTDGL